MIDELTLSDRFLAAHRPSVAWVDDQIEIIDQVALPEVVSVLSLVSVAAVLDAIQRLAVRGAPAIGVCGAYGMVVGLDERCPVTVADARNDLDDLARLIGSARPTAVNLAWATERVRAAAADGTSLAEIRGRALEAAHAIARADRESCARIGLIGRQEFREFGRILTHCNTGRLATTGWGTALGVVYAKVAMGDTVEVYASETRPLLQGARLTAWELADAGIDVTLMPDGASAQLFAEGRVDAVLVGADRIANNGDTANKIGTFTHAVNAARAGVPFYVAAPLSTFDPSMPTGADIVIEQRPADELRSWRSTPTAPEGCSVWNPAFDVTPGELIAGIITEVGVLRPPFIRSIPGALRSIGNKYDIA